MCTLNLASQDANKGELVVRAIKCNEGLLDFTIRFFYQFEMCSKVVADYTQAGYMWSLTETLWYAWSQVALPYTGYDGTYLICKTSLTTTTETCNLSLEVCQQQLLQQAIRFFSWF